MTIPVLAAFLFYAKAREDGAPRATGILAWLLFVAGLLVKETAAVLPLLLVLFELARLFPTRATPRVWRLLAGFLLIFGLYLAWRYHVLGFLSRSQITVPVGTLVATWPWLAAFYMGKLVWPVGLSAFYTTPYVTEIGFANFGLPLLSLAAAAVALAALARRQKNGVVLAGALWMLLPLLPLLNTTVFVKEFAHDRYLYLPSFGFCLIAAALLGALGRVGLAVAGVLTLAGLGVSVSEAAHWRDEVSLYLRGVEIAPKSAMARHNLAVQLYRRGQQDDARLLLHEVLVDDPDFWLSNYALGEIYQSRNDCGRAVTYYARAVSIKPAHLRSQGVLIQCLLQLGQVETAEQRVREALGVLPPSAGMSYVLGVVLEEKGDIPGAIAAYETDLALNPRSIARPKLDALRAKPD
jgi:tetratricopeptide (TPR) repeat protein